ncbi:hypothetical protein D5086_007807 [Populus alba]|uniref:Uncharacterized protein n=1 Tax=Populus alba TaxID=43335 RepID=A0ACC4CE92_POPAL
MARFDFHGEESPKYDEKARRQMDDSLDRVNKDVTHLLYSPLSLASSPLKPYCTHCIGGMFGKLVKDGQLTITSQLTITESIK